LAQLERLGLLGVGELLMTAHEALDFVGAPPDSFRALVDLDRLSGSRAEALFHDVLDAYAVQTPSVGESVLTLGLVYAQAIVNGRVSPRQGAWKIYELGQEGRELGATQELLDAFNEMDDLLILRDEAEEELSGSPDEERRAELAARVEHDDREIRQKANELLVRYGLDENATLAIIQLAAADTQ
jgi:hypothetical protein